MRWFKHLVETKQDEKVSKLLVGGGIEARAAYGLWWLLVEAVARQVDKGSKKCSVTYALTKWSQELSVRGSHVKRSLSKLALIGLIEVEWKGSEATVTIPNLLKYRDEYQSRIGSNSGSRIQIQKQKTETEGKPSVPKRASGEVLRDESPQWTAEQREARANAFAVFERIKTTPEGKAVTEAMGL